MYHTFYIVKEGWHIVGYGYVVTETNDMAKIVAMIKSKIKDVKNKTIEIVKIVFGK